MTDLLIVDDDAECCREIHVMLENSQYNYLTTTVSTTAERGLHVLKQSQPDLVLFDMSLPDMSGVDFAKQAIQLHPQTFAIVITQLKMFDPVYEAINAGCSGYLLKPLSKSELLALFDRLFQLRLLRQGSQFKKDGSHDTNGAVDLGNPIESVLAYLASHYQEPITMQEVAEKVYLSPSYFSRLFKAEMGTTFTEYLTNFRIKKSKLLLRMTALSMDVVANSTGFSNASYFATTFKRIDGRTPSDYRALFSNFKDDHGAPEVSIKTKALTSGS
ncbi:helix-turn-helix domain-containing protein [Alicyclobacillus dauci]|uniref:Response regulator transcription factor n=1 Tax=Alicyclobacillus dauci TaxID=1475485 RepID=A0ABY6Z6X7_9BACL|nr:helix-turn-helix domain-containing protein [Alicyclobacillus dauci]WAH38009.1 response regulator transcription factor [Alicyclobacillus dauci]